jgi:hypothetical protein
VAVKHRRVGIRRLRIACCRTAVTVVRPRYAARQWT